MTKGVPAPTLRRLPLYYRELKLAVADDVLHISSRELGERVGVPASQVRKDLSYLDEKGKSGVGYESHCLASHLETFLGLINDKEAALVGVGNLGRALALYPGFDSYGLRIVALFDNDPAKLGEQVNGLEVLSVDRLIECIARRQLRLGIITTPVEAAQEVAAVMVAGGIRAIWNFAPCNLNVPAEVFVKNEDLAASLALLSHVVEQFRLRD